MEEKKTLSDDSSDVPDLVEESDDVLNEDEKDSESKPAESAPKLKLRQSTLIVEPDESKKTTPFVLNPSKFMNPVNASDIPSKSSDQSNEPTKENNDNSISFVPLCPTSTNTIASSQSTLPSSTSSNTTFSLTNSAIATNSSHSILNNTNSSSSTSNNTSSVSESASSFIFGQNLRERVVEANINENSSENITLEPKTNGTINEMLFTAVLKENSEMKNSDSSVESKSLSEAAREYEESRAVKRKYEAVTVMTGEEEESNVLQMNCKLFAFDKNVTSFWQERGRGTLRLNDLQNNGGSRLIFRTSGSLRLALNTKVWSGMTVQRASDRSLRFTAMDSSGMVKVFLVTATVKEVDQLKKYLEWRINLKKSSGNCDDIAVNSSISINEDTNTEDEHKKLKVD